MGDTPRESGFVRLMADYCSDGVWGRDGVMLCLDELPIGEELRRNIERWCGFYEPSEFYLSPEERKRPFDVVKFNAWGEVLAERLRGELPDWEIVHQKERQS